MTTTEDIVAAVKSLPDTQRLQLLDRLMEVAYPTDAEIDAAWERELARREQALLRGEASLIDGDQIIAHAKGRLMG